MSQDLISKLFDMGLITTRGDHIPTLEENQARLRREQADICKRMGLSIGPKEKLGFKAGEILLHRDPDDPTLDCEVEFLRDSCQCHTCVESGDARSFTVKVLTGPHAGKEWGLYPKDVRRKSETHEAQPDRDSIANLARTALHSIDLVFLWGVMDPSHIADAKRAVELILAEATK